MIICGTRGMKAYAVKKLQADNQINIMGCYETVDEFREHDCQGAECALLADSWYEVHKWSFALEHMGISKVYRMPVQVMQYQKELSCQGQLNTNNILELGREDVFLEYLETHVEDACNLKCRGCMHFSNLVTQSCIPKLDKFKQDIFRMRELFSYILIIRLLGGEPFLNPEIGKYIAAVREAFPLAEIRIVTNGLLIPKLPLHIWEELRQYEVMVDISQYPPTEKLMPVIRQILDDNHVPYGTAGVVREFRKSLREGADSDEKKSVQVCGSSYCRFLRDGYIAKCPLPIMIRDLNEKYHTAYDETEFYDIYQEQDGRILKKKLDDYAHFCRYCPDRAEFIPWQPTVHNAELSDWIV